MSGSPWSLTMVEWSLSVRRCKESSSMGGLRSKESSNFKRFLTSKFYWKKFLKKITENQFSPIPGFFNGGMNEKLVLSLDSEFKFKFKALRTHWLQSKLLINRGKGYDDPSHETTSNRKNLSAVITTWCRYPGSTAALSRPSGWTGNKTFQSLSTAWNNTRGFATRWAPVWSSTTWYALQLDCSPRQRERKKEREELKKTRNRKQEAAFSFQDNLIIGFVC